MATRLNKLLGHFDNSASNDMVSSICTANDNPTRNHEKVAFKMYLNPGQVKEYKRRHDLIPSQWPKLKELVKNAGVSDYSIFFDEENDVLFAVLWRTKDHKMDELPDKEIMQKWWSYMSSIMKTDDLNQPISVDLPCVFHME